MSKEPETFRAWLREEFNAEQLQSMATNGANTGWHGLIQTQDLMALFREHRDEIRQIIRENPELAQRKDIQALMQVEDYRETASDMVFYAAERIAYEETQASLGKDQQIADQPKAQTRQVQRAQPRRKETKLVSRYYDMSISIEGYQKEKQAKIVKAAQEMWPGLDTLDQSARFMAADKGWVMFAGGEGSLSGGQKEFAQEFAQAIWQANQDFCRVEIEATYLDDLPFETYSFGEEDYQKTVEAEEKQPDQTQERAELQARLGQDQQITQERQKAQPQTRQAQQSRDQDERTM